ncbi:tRNA (N6-threonylcarbamoyladenosine(37)-N6)-methyltransferase TrmO [Parathalassolituus penaei]|uniref:tRNA (N6-threonylcarbamoyladenosine(37)-N6)-methyltransferase TrmO n=1 Tax=Parathalassolituus penaei TaxID=2997323 RepID=A0A9X3IUA4_9GAMM|nr:tRNA (N6-threonylcarbamoyladenosine(37)-N6)-methyltransferase TrmO [Parathalassolituus penaei]MCY0965963.1 tRNA (N6-threonylcarbamoyladenosine(37)-N6)-methyltransferase TrmO [Parathalassolituus penaei]
MYQIQPVAIARTPFREKFAIPRQPMLAPAAIGTIELQPPFDQAAAFEGLELNSHVWLIFLFHQALPDPDKPPRLRVRPPRLGGNERMGVFATRSSHRPNGIGQSLVKLESINGTSIRVSGIDLMDGTPIIDIKPYIPYADCLPHATSALAPDAPAAIQVEWSSEARLQVEVQQARLQQPLQELIEQCLAQDPRPAYQTPQPEREYGAGFYDVDVRWHYPTADCIRVLAVEKLA